MIRDELQEKAQRHLLLHFSKQADELLVISIGARAHMFRHGAAAISTRFRACSAAQLGYSYGEEMAAAAAAQMTTLAFNTNWGTAHPAADRARRAAGRRSHRTG